MSPIDHLHRAITSIEQVLKATTEGTADRPRRTTLIDVALDRAEAWRQMSDPSQDASRGGSSSPATIEETQERLRVARLANEAATEIPAIVKDIDDLAFKLYGYVQRLTAVVHPDKYPTSQIPGCSSCARSEGTGGQRIGGHFAEIYDRFPKARDAGLCRWCYDFDQATGELPPVRACHIFHSQGPRAAGLWLAKAQRKAS